MKKLSKVTLSCIGLMGFMVLAGCSVGADEGETVEAGPSLCILARNNGAESALMNVTCTVKIGDAQASKEGIDTSVTNIMQILILPDMCPAFRKDEVLADSSQFDEELRSELSDAYVRSGNGWTVQSVACKFAELALN